MLQQDEPDDYVIASGQQKSVREFVEAVCKELDMQLEWKGKGLHERGIASKTGNEVVAVDSRYFRPTEADTLPLITAALPRGVSWPGAEYQRVARK